MNNEQGCPFDDGITNYAKEMNNEQKALELEAERTLRQASIDRSNEIFRNQCSEKIYFQVGFQEGAEWQSEQPKEINRQEIFNYFAEEHGLILLENDIQEIQRLFKPTQPKQ